MAIGFSILGVYFMLIILGYATVSFNPEGFWIALPFVAMMAGVAILSIMEKKNKEDEVVTIISPWQKEPKEDTD